MKLFIEGGDAMSPGRNRRLPGRRGTVGSNQYIRHEVSDPSDDIELKRRMDQLKSGGVSQSTAAPVHQMDDSDIIEALSDDPDDVDARQQLVDRYPQDYCDAVLSASRRGDTPPMPSGQVSSLAAFISEYRGGDDGPVSGRIATVTALQTRFRSEPSTGTVDEMESEMNQLNSDRLARIGL